MSLSGAMRTLEAGSRHNLNRGDMTQSGTLSPKKQSVLLALCTTNTMRDASRDTGIPVRTLYRWMKEDAFKRALQEQQSFALHQAFRVLVFLLPKAVRALEAVLENPQERGANTKRLTAETIISSSLRYLDFIELESRVSRLEEAIREKQ